MLLQIQEEKMLQSEVILTYVTQNEVTYQQMIEVVLRVNLLPETNLSPKETL